ncbi:MAG: T9SS type A sorting domain-containing protein, partial [Phaeodactylibacter sp.]|nr:T9SS type A sorting domain-containing protein [Phaeodactylibacter sp.]
PVRMAVYDMSGRRLEVLVNSFQEAGEYQVEWNASNYPAGIYFARTDGADGQLLQVLKLVKFK